MSSPQSGWCGLQFYTRVQFGYSLMGFSVFTVMPTPPTLEHFPYPEKKPCAPITATPHFPYKHYSLSLDLPLLDISCE